MFWLHPGAGDLRDLTNETQEVLRQVEKFYATCGFELFVTHMKGGMHMDGSLHPIGRAFDIKYPPGKAMKEFKRRLISYIRMLYGKDVDIVFHAFHIHIEYDPKKGKK